MVYFSGKKLKYGLNNTPVRGNVYWPPVLLVDTKTIANVFP